MRSQKMTLLLLGLMCFSSISGFFTVICHGSDGHVMVVPAVHNRCECSESGESSSQYTLGGITTESSADHGHCSDSLLDSDFIVAARKNIKLSPHEVYTANFFLKPNSACFPSVFSSFAMQSDDLSSFYAPLRTVILLA